MIKLEKILYTAKAHTTGGRDGGSARTDNRRLEVTLSDPGASGAGTNPEQLFAVGWSACFLSALKLVAGKKSMALASGASNIRPYTLPTTRNAEVEYNVVTFDLVVGTAQPQHA